MDQLNVKFEDKLVLVNKLAEIHEKHLTDIDGIIEDHSN
jgi:hypothetical protein